MNLTISLGAEFSKYTNEITNVYTTRDYTETLQNYYKDHVMNPSDDNPFTVVYNFRKSLVDPTFKMGVCETPLADMGTAKEELQHVIRNRKAYAHIARILMANCKGISREGNLIFSFLKVFTTNLKKIHKSAMEYDRHMGDTYSAASVIKALNAYGIVSGLVDYYNLKEGKDGR